MVKGLKMMVGSNEDSRTIKQVRRNQDGRILLAFKKGELKMDEIKQQIQANWEGVVVSNGGRRDLDRCTLHVKGLDDAVEDQKIKEAICGVAPALQRESMEIGPRRPMFGGNYPVTVRVVGKGLRQVRGRNKIRIGFNMCTVEERVEITKCFRCWEFGHIARNCNGGGTRGGRM